jgi:hypothetical protein
MSNGEQEQQTIRCLVAKVGLDGPDAAPMSSPERSASRLRGQLLGPG